MIASIRTCRVPPYGSVIPRSIYIQKRFLSNSSDNNTNKPSSEQDSNESNTKQGKKLVSSLLFGSKSDRENVEEFQKSFSYHLMRGKYVHEIVKDKVRPDLCSRYQELMYVDLVLKCSIVKHFFLIRALLWTIFSHY